MNAASSNSRMVCWACKAVCKPGANACWLCGEPIGAGAPPADPDLPPLAVLAAQGKQTAPSATGRRPTQFERHASFQFGLSTLLIVVTLVAIFCSLIKLSPGLGIFLLFLTSPAFAHLCASSLRAQAKGKPLSGMEKIQLFARTTVIAVATLAIAAVVLAVAAIVALAVICSGSSGSFR